jgi:ParB/RepB/Spo0J family partition protein
LNNKTPTQKRGGMLGAILAGNMDGVDSLKLQTATLMTNAQSQYKQTKIPDRIKELDPHKCRLWKYADRPEDEAVHTSEIATSMDSVEQISPVIVREISIDDLDYPTIEYEIIAGSVRWRAAKLRNKPLKAVIKVLDDRQAISVMIAENEHRKGITPFSRSLQMQTIWESGMFSSQDELALAHYMDKSKASMHLKIASNADFLIKLYGEEIKRVGLRSLYDSCNFEREEDSSDKKEKSTKIPFEGFIAKMDKNGITTLKFSKNISEEKLARIKLIIDE